MKRWTGIGLFLTLALSLTACGEATPADLYEKALKKFYKADAAVVSVHQQLSMGDGSTVMSSTLDGELRVMNPDGKKTKAVMEGNMSIDLGGGSAMNVPLSYYYQDDTMYANMVSTQYCMEMDWEEACKKMGPGVLPLSGLEEEDFSSLQAEENDDVTVLEFSVSGEQVAKITGVLDQWTEFAETSAEAGTISFQNAEGKLTLENGRPVKEVLLIIGMIQNGDQVARVTEQIELSINYKDVEVNLPDLSAYQNLG